MQGHTTALAPDPSTSRDFARVGLTPLRSTEGKQRFGRTSKMASNAWTPSEHRGERCCALGQTWQEALTFEQPFEGGDPGLFTWWINAIQTINFTKPWDVIKHLDYELGIP